MIYPYTHVFHPADFSESDRAAFAHALRIAVSSKARLTLLHIDDPDVDVDWADYPSVRPTLARWGILPESASKEALKQLGLKVVKVLRTAHDPAKAITEYVEEHCPNLVVLATRQRQGLARWWHSAMAEPIARRTHAQTLFLPRRVNGFVSAETGALTLQRVLIPIDHAPLPHSAVHATIRLGTVLGCANLHFVFLHVKRSGHSVPELTTELPAGWTKQLLVREGAVEETILATATEEKVDLISMATQGHQGFLDALRGSTTERVLRAAKCPVLAVPAE